MKRAGKPEDKDPKRSEPAKSPKAWRIDRDPVEGGVETVEEALAHEAEKQEKTKAA